MLFLAKKQWMNFEGSPETFLFYFDKPINYDLSFGLQAYNDRQSRIQNTSLKSGLSYILRLTKQQQISFGLSAVLAYQQLDTENLPTHLMNDIAIQNRMDNTFWFDAQFGMSYRNRNFVLGISMPEMLHKGLNSENRFGNIELLNHQSFNSYMTYTFTNKRSAWYLKPIVSAYYSTTLPWYVEATAMVGHEEYGEAGLGYRTRYGAIAYLNVNINEALSFGYSYDYPIARTDHRFLGSSHELMLAIRFGRKRHQMYKGYKFGKKRKYKYVPGRRTKPSSPTNSSGQTVKPETKDNPYEKNIHEEDIVVDIETKPDIVVKEGGHPMELPKGHYVVIGVFNLDQKAKNYMDRVVDDGFPAQFGYSSENKKYYVYLYRSDDKYDALWEVERLKQIDVFQQINYLLVE